MAYTAEEFDHAAKSFKHSHYADESVILAALRIASAVMNDELMRNAWRRSIDQVSDADAIAVIRAALTDAKP